MEKLPIEILNNVFLLLHQRDKVECMIVCRRWATLINRYSLFHTIRVDNMRQLEEVFRRLDKEPVQKTKVKRLLLDFYMDTGFELNTIPSFFPNLRVLGSTDTDRLPATIPQGINCIEHIAEVNSSTWTLHLLGTSVCSQLKTLNFSAINISGEKLITLLGNAPSLTELTLSFCRISLDTLEQLHSALPLLKTLEFKQIFEIGGDLPLNIACNSLITTFTMEFYFVPETLTKSLVLKYVINKYINLKRLEFKEPHSSLVDEEDANVWYNEGLYPLIRKLGCQFTELSLFSNFLPETFFRLMDDARCSLKSLELERPIQPSLANSNQLACIQSLSLSRINAIDVEVLVSAKMLKTLSLSFIPVYDEEKERRTSVDLDELLSSCADTVETLKLSHARLDLIPPSSQHFQSIKCLILRHVYLPCGITNMLSTTLPGLQTLKMYNCDLTRKMIMLHGINLHAIEIDDVNAINKNILVKTLDDNKTQWWVTGLNSDFSYQRSTYFHADDAPMHPKGSFLPLRYLDYAPMITLECNSVKSIVVL